MIQTVRIRDLIIGQGKPKVIVPIVGCTHSDILASAGKMDFAQIDLVEWRVDFYEDVFDANALSKTLKELRRIIENTPLLFTFRTKNEGGEREISQEKYVELNLDAARTGMVDLIDVEIMSGDEAVEKLISSIHGFNVKVIASNHDFHKTPPREDLIFRLRKMQNMNADILKIAVMPKSKEDVLELLSATDLMNLNYAEKPIVTMAMGSLGVVTRLSGEVFGSSMTFGAVGQTSAPGQIPVDELDTVLRIIHKAIN
jgi:3-dehydroquinate dehydratase-1